MIRDSDLCTKRYGLYSPKCPERLWGPPISYSVGNGGVSPVVSDRSVRLTTCRLALRSSRKSRSIPPHPKYAIMTCAGNTLLKYINLLKTAGGGTVQGRTLHLIVLEEGIRKIHSSENFQAAPACPSGKCRLNTC